MWNILIVEDNETDRKLLANGLKDVGDCLACDSGEIAVNIFKEWRDSHKYFDFILLDVTMPGQDGFQTLKSIRAIEEAKADPHAKEAKVIMVTSFKDSLMENYNMGWDDFLTKPVDISILISRMKEMLESQNA